MWEEKIIFSFILQFSFIRTSIKFETLRVTIIDILKGVTLPGYTTGN